ncbi:MAG: helix-turn-helix domain-containing protein [Lewinellaceae bacterium]|nr:helix-turn-helix domain-containing protein [Lewinellaceae bacterium]
MKFQFKRNKYGRELLIDCEQMSKVKGFTLDDSPFWIDFHEIFIITSGKGVFRLDNERIQFKAGTTLLLPPNKWRQWQLIEGQLDGYILIFEEEFISKFFNDGLFLYRFHYFYNNVTPSFIQIDKDRINDFLSRLKEIKNELAHLGSDSEHFLRAILYYILIHINRCYKEQHKVEFQFFEDNLTLSFKKLMEAEIRRYHNVSDYATALNVSKSHLNKTIKESLGKNTSEIIRERLIAEAKREILYSNLSISEISYALNFTEPSNFNRFFKGIVKMTPNEYRAIHSK